MAREWSLYLEYEGYKVRSLDGKSDGDTNARKDGAMEVKSEGPAGSMIVEGTDGKSVGCLVRTFEGYRVGIIDGKSAGDEDGRNDYFNVSVIVGETVGGDVCSPKIIDGSDEVNLPPFLISLLS